MLIKALKAPNSAVHMIHYLWNKNNIKKKLKTKGIICWGSNILPTFAKEHAHIISFFFIKHFYLMLYNIVHLVSKDMKLYVIVLMCLPALLFYSLIYVQNLRTLTPELNIYNIYTLTLCLSFPISLYTSTYYFNKQR